MCAFSEKDNAGSIQLIFTDFCYSCGQYIVFSFSFSSADNAADHLLPTIFHHLAVWQIVTSWCCLGLDVAILDYGFSGIPVEVPSVFGVLVSLEKDLSLLQVTLSPFTTYPFCLLCHLCTFCGGYLFHSGNFELKLSGEFGISLPSFFHSANVFSFK